MSELHGPRQFRFSDPRHERIHRRLARLIGPGAAAFFRDACKVVEEAPAFQTTSHIVGHLLRETESSIRYAFQPLIKSAGPRPKDAGHRFQIEQTLSALNIPLTDPVAKAWLAIAGKENDKGLAGLAHRRDLGPPRPFDGGARQAVEQIVTVLDAVLEKVEARWEVFLATFDALAKTEHPNAKHAEELRLRLPNSLQARSHFFGQLGNPEWLDPLGREGFFKQPPEPVVDDEADTILFPPWPESQFLLRMAQAGVRAVQEQVVAIAGGIPDADNVRVYDDLASIALAVPPDLANRLVPRIQAKLPLPYSSQFPLHVADLVVHLTTAGLVTEALGLARTLLALDSDPRAERYETPPEHQIAPLPGPQPRMHPAFYDDVLEKMVPALFKASPHQTTELLADLLEQGLRLAQRTASQAGPEAQSQVWWPDLTLARPSVADDPPAMLLDALRGCVMELVAKDAGAALGLVAAFEAKPWHVFRRLSLLLLRLTPDLPVGEIERRLLRLEDHEIREFHREYVDLLRESYPNLGAPAQHTIREYLARERDQESLVENFRFWSGRDPSPQDIAQRQDEWRAARLEPVAEYLPAEIRDQYDVWARTLEPRSEPTPPAAGWGSPRSPRKSEDLAGMEDDALVNYLANVDLGDERFGLSREGLGESLTQAVTSDPDRFVRLAPRFRDLDPAYQHALFAGLHDVLARQSVFSWPPILDLAVVVTSSTPDPASRRGGGHSPDDLWVRRAILDLVARGLEPGPGELPFELRPRIWSVLEPLTADPDPTPDEDAKHTSAEERETLYLNSLRGRALDAVWGYSVWIYRHDHKDGSRPMTFGPIPEVRSILGRHLDPEHEPSPAIRVFYGQHLQQLRRLDPEWLHNQVKRILPRDLELLSQSAWQAYLSSAQVQPPDFEILRPWYEQAVAEVGSDLSGDTQRSAEHLGRHLARLQWLGVISPREPGGLLERYFAQASPALRGETLEFVALTLNNTSDAPAPVLERMRMLWEWRRETAEGTVEREQVAEEMAAFGRWFACPQLDPEWTLRELNAALRLSGRVELAPTVVSRLAILSERFPKAAIECLDLMVGGRDRDFGPDFWLHDARPVLENARRSPDPATQQAAIVVINRLSALGFTQFRDLL